MATLFFLLPEGAEARPGPGRYEFRCWPRRPPAAVSTLQRAWQLDQCEVRTDIYLLSPLSGHRLVKLRSGSRLETKRLLDRPGPLEYWSDPLAKSFPLEVESLAALAADLGLTGPLPAAAALSPAHLVAELADQVGAVRV
ncbi:MAG TPA: hypothetical protein VKA18_15770, partial [Alphaproteobacteria bacterium]|nr:hypothetical protein [Alphaproteobacteria bacterium]